MGGFNGSGTYVRYYNWTADASNAIPIMASRMDTEDNGFATALTNCITRDGQGVPSANISWNNHKLTSLSDAVDPQDALNQRAGDARYAPIQYRAYKTTDEPRNTNIIPANDGALVINSLPAGTYKIEASIFCGSLGGAGLRAQFAFSGTTTQSAMAYIQYAGGGSFGNYSQGTLTTTFFYATLSTGSFININGTIVVSVSGNLAFQWAQNASSGSNTTIFAGSFLKLEKLV